MHDIAAEMGALTSVLKDLHGIITEKTGLRVAKPRFIRDITQVIRKIRRTQEEIRTMIDDKSIILKLLRSATRAERLLSHLQRDKVTLTLQMLILSIALQYPTKLVPPL
jgi:hypothetical protein